MRTALYAGLVGGSVSLLSVPLLAAEDTSLRGLKIPRYTLDADISALDITPSEPGLKWRSVDTLQDLASRVMRFGGSFETRRFSLSDTDVRVSVYRPQAHASLGGSGSLDRLHDLLPKYTLHRQVSQSLGGGWGLGFGVRQSEYNFASNQLYSVFAERYAGNFRSAYTLYSNRTDGSDLGAAHRFQVNYFYGDRNTVGLAYTTGRELENVGLWTGLPLNDARDWTLSGRHWLSTNWALTYDLLSHEQGSAYKRQGLRLGVSRSF